MLNSDFSLTQIALEIGMCDQAHFCRTFRRVVGINPNAWRRQTLSQPPPRLMAPTIRRSE
jgi:AraC-like DNA-binding protein